MDWLIEIGCLARAIMLCLRLRLRWLGLIFC